MSTSYIEDKNILAYCVEKRKFDTISEYIENSKDKFSFYIENKDEIYGYKINKIKQLSEIYGEDFYSIIFYFKNIDHFFNEEQNLIIDELIKELNNRVNMLKGYFILKVPSDNTMLINSINIHVKKSIFAGGTICYSAKELRNKEFDEDSLVIRSFSKEEKVCNKEEIVKLGAKSFEKYFGQYHISYCTREKAPLIYKNWVDNIVDNGISKDMIVALYNDSIVGFLTLEDTEYTTEMVLSAVDERYRGLKIYERMIREGVKISFENKKIATLSTQFDNFLVQRAWINIGFKPYYSFYNFHINNI